WPSGSNMPLRSSLEERSQPRFMNLLKVFSRVSSSGLIIESSENGLLLSLAALFSQVLRDTLTCCSSRGDVDSWAVCSMMRLLSEVKKSQLIDRNIATMFLHP